MGLRYLGKHPCPDCLVEKDNIWKMGRADDMATRAKSRGDDKYTDSWYTKIRRWIFREGRAPEGQSVKETPLWQESRATTQVSASPWLLATVLTFLQSAFSIRLSPLGVNPFKLFVPDVMHEFDLGVWKSTLTHLIRMVISQSDDSVQELDKR